MKLSRLTNRQLRNLLRKGEVRFAATNPMDIQRQNAIQWYKELKLQKEGLKKLAKEMDGWVDSYWGKIFDVRPFHRFRDDLEYDLGRNCLFKNSKIVKDEKAMNRYLALFDNIQRDYDRLETSISNFKKMFKQYAMADLQKIDSDIKYLEPYQK